MFTKDSWIVRDICAKEPFPFRDKELDFVVCSHTLEDIRDPLWVCSEIIRIGKAGYIEVPSRLWETCRGMEPGIAGLSHHRLCLHPERAQSGRRGNPHLFRANHQPEYAAGDSRGKDGGPLVDQVCRGESGVSGAVSNQPGDSR